MFPTKSGHWFSLSACLTTEQYRSLTFIYHRRCLTGITLAPDSVPTMRSGSPKICLYVSYDNNVSSSPFLTCRAAWEHYTLIFILACDIQLVAPQFLVANQYSIGTLRKPLSRMVEQERGYVRYLSAGRQIKISQPMIPICESHTYAGSARLAVPVSLPEEMEQSRRVEILTATTSR